MVYVNASVQNRGVATQHADYIAYTEQWTRCRDVISGQDAIQKKGEVYLPKLKNQNDTDYRAYLKRSTLFNATSRTVSGLNGMLFRKPPQNDAPKGIDPLLNDIDMCGMPFDVFSQEVSEQCLSVGRIGVLVDYPVAPVLDKPLTIAIAQKLALRPSMKIYITENIINWKFKQINKVWTLAQVVLHEVYSEPALDSSGQPSEFENKTEDRWRVLDLENDVTYRIRVFNKDANGNDNLVDGPVYPLMNNKTMNYIPFIVMTPDGMSFEVEEPPLLDLVNTNLSHYRTTADYEHGCHFTALPTLFIKGYTSPVAVEGEAPEQIYLGSQAAITLSDTQADAKFIEFTGQGLATLERNLDRKEQQMAILGARMLAAEKKQAETATTAAIYRTGENSVLSAISIAVSLGLSKALTIFSEWAGYAQECKYELNRDFLPVVIDGPTLTAYIQAYQKQAINEEELFDLLQRGDIIEAEITLEEHKAGTFADPAPTPIVGTPGSATSLVPPNPRNQT